MPRYIAFLRAINVGGHTVKMDILRTLFEEIGLSDVETFIASGNVIFTSRSRSAASLERKIEAHLLKSLGFEVATFLRTDAEVDAVARSAPFEASRVRSAKNVSVGFLSKPLEQSARQALMALANANDAFHVSGREIYWLSQTGQADSKFSNVVFERTVKARVTFRGVKTVAKLTAKYPP